MKRSVSSVSHSDLYSVTSSVVWTFSLHYITNASRKDSTHRWQEINNQTSCKNYLKALWCTDDQNPHLNNKDCNNKGARVTAGCRCARQARRLQRRIQSLIKDTKQYCNPWLWSREHKLGQIGRRVSAVRFRPPLHYNAWWAGPWCAIKKKTKKQKNATAALRVTQTDTEGETDTARLHTHLFPS